MAVESTEKWSEQGTSLRWSGPGVPLTFSARKGWIVTGATNDAQARTAAPLDGASHKIPAIGASHPLDGRCICIDLPVEWPGPTTALVRAVYEIPSAQLDDTDPLRAKPIIRREYGSLSYPCDVDVDGNAIINSALDTPDPFPTRSVSVLQMSITVNVPFLLAAKAIQYTDTVNSDRFEIIGAGFVDPGQCHCAGFHEIQGERQGQTFVSVTANFELADLITIGGEKWSLFDTRFPDVSYTGFSSAGKGPITFKSGDDAGKRVPIPVSLNGYGRPYRLDDFGIGASALPGASQNTSPPGSTKLDTGRAMFLGYKTKVRRAFTGIL